MKRISYNLGISITEIMIVLLITVFLLVAGLPTYQTFQKNNTASALANALNSSLRLARTEAIKRGNPVVICATDNSFTNCTSTTAWTTWAVFVDLNNDQSLNTGELLYTFESPTADSVESSRDHIIYEPTGFARMANQFNITPDGCNYGRAISLLQNGSFSSRRIDCP